MPARVLTLLCLAAIIAYVQRAAISVPTKLIEQDLGITTREMGWILSAWYWGYAFGQLPAGWLADRWGSRRALITFASLWSLALVATSLAGTFWAFLTAWALMGWLQAAIFPSATKAIGVWFASDRRAMASGALVACQAVGFALAPALTAFLLLRLSWQVILAIYALPGLAWALVYFLSVPQKVEPMPVKVSLRAGIARSLTSVPMILLCTQQFLRGAAMTFFFTWFPRFLQETRGLEQTQAGYLAAFPGVGSMLGGLLGGICSDALLRWTGRRRLSRQGVAVAGMLACAALALLASTIQDPYLAVGLISLGAFWGTFGGVSGYSCAIEFGGRRVATVFATMNMCGNIGAALFPLLVTALIAAYADWNLILPLFAFIFFVDAICWALFNPRTTLFPEDES
jgi:MFS family permease